MEIQYALHEIRPRIALGPDCSRGGVKGVMMALVDPVSSVIERLRETEYHMSDERVCENYRDQIDMPYHQAVGEGS